MTQDILHRKERKRETNESRNREEKEVSSVNPLWLVVTGRALFLEELLCLTMAKYRRAKVIRLSQTDFMVPPFRDSDEVRRSLSKIKYYL